MNSAVSIWYSILVASGSSIYCWALETESFRYIVSDALLTKFIEMLYIYIYICIYIYVCIYVCISIYARTYTHLRLERKLWKPSGVKASYRKHCIYAWTCLARRFVVRQSGVGFCHMDQMSCFGEDHGTLGSLMRTLIERKNNAPAGSYTKVCMCISYVWCLCIYVCAFMHIHMYVCIYICVCIYIYILQIVSIVLLPLRIVCVQHRMMHW